MAHKKNLPKMYIFTKCLQIKCQNKKRLKKCNKKSQ